MTIVHNLEDFQRGVDRFVRKHASGESILIIQRRLLLEAHAKLSLYSPVDTGFLRYNYQITAGRPASGTRGVEGETQVASPTGALLPEDAAAIASLRPFSVAWITNNAAYAEYVNNGTPKMRAHLMLERSVSDLTQQILRAA